MATTVPAGDDVRRPSAAVERMRAAWSVVDDLMGGTLGMRAAGTRRLPRWSADDDADYLTRLGTAVLFPAYARTVSVLTGKPFSKPITLGDDVPPRIAAWLDDADAENRNLDAFAAAVFYDALAYGVSGIMVDAPVAAGARTVAEESALGVRPYLVHVKHDQVLGWRTARRGGSTVLAQLRLLETVEEDDGPYAVKTVEQVRVLTPGRWEVHRKADRSDRWELYDEGPSSIDEIPYVPVYGKRLDFMVGEPPMLDLAHLNVKHWQSESDQQTILHFARLPIVFARGVMDGEVLTIGAGAVIRTQDPAADMKFVEHSGSAIGAGRASIADDEDRMRQIGAELLVVKPGNITETQSRADDEPAVCDLKRLSQSAEDGVDQALQLMAAYVGEPTGGHVSFFSDYGVASQTEASAQLLAGLWKDGGLSHATLIRELKRRGSLAPETDVDAEVDAAESERDAEANAAAAREHAMLAAAAAGPYAGDEHAN